MKRFKLDLSEYDVTYDVPVIVDDKPVFENGTQKMESKTEAYPLKENIVNWLRTVGIFRTGEEIAEAVVLAKQVRETEETNLTLDEREVQILKKTLNRFIELTIDGEVHIGGPIHEEAILRIFNIQEVK